MSITDFRVQRAIERDERDSERLAAIADLVGRAIDALIPLSRALEYPYATWGPGNLLESLQSHALEIAEEQRRVRRSVLVLDDDDY